MVSDLSQVADTSPPVPGGGAVRDKVRIRFRKAGDLRLVSHHDLMKCFERMLRRAALPFHVTQGFHPKPRLVFALSLALGVVGCQEVVELELDRALSPEEIHQRLAVQAPPGLEIVSVRRIAPKAHGQVRRVCYRLALPAERTRELPQRMAAVLAAPECWIERTRPQRRRINLRPYLRHVHLFAAALEIDLWVTPQGTARPEEVLALLGLSDVLEAGTILERTTLELHDEVSPAIGPDGPGLAPEARPAGERSRQNHEHAPEVGSQVTGAGDQADSPPEGGAGVPPEGSAGVSPAPQGRPHQPAAKPTALIGSPLNFDS
jgi:radical SAM-linked protein